MSHTIKRPLMATVLLLLLMPFFIEASHRNRGVDRSSLDDDVAESFPVPVLFALSHDDLVPDFGDPRGGGTRLHEGQDMLTPEGTPIVSPTEAVVSRIGEGSSAGLYVYTAAPGGETFRYMHLETIADIDEGDKLDVGDFIGTVGDTGNAPDGVYHLHFEVRDENNRAVDPIERLTETFTLEQQMDFLSDVMNKYDGNKERYAAFLVSEFEDEFVAAMNDGYDDWHRDIEDALEDTDAMVKGDLMEQFNNLIDSIPLVLQSELSAGDQGTRVALLQTYLLFRSSGEARDRLAGSGATGYYGTITAGAVLEWQEANDLSETGVWDEESWEEVN